ncbi:unnamed protein product [Dovyalis caffra]|uniref:BURP domain-containing protein n=1 Tax=Dovyalis caffra TaxID=77055 RepID=A0AAV1R8E5_9ROSI|nr:unnamed protein product [Dovyalis caffra]
MPIHFPTNDPSLLSHFLPREEADVIPFSLKELPNLFQFFSVSRGSCLAKSLEDTKHCEFEPMKRETNLLLPSQESGNKVLEVTLEGENGDRVEAASVCHMDTSARPGTSPVCHFFSPNNLRWVPISSTK